MNTTRHAMTEALGGGSQGLRVANALAAVGIHSLDDLRQADAGTFTPPADHKPNELYASIGMSGIRYEGDLGAVRNIGPSAMKRIRRALDGPR